MQRRTLISTQLKHRLRQRWPWLGLAGMLVGLATALTSFWSCGVERPGVVGGNQGAVGGFLHAGHTDSCVSCHEKDRKAPDATGKEHGGGKDCVACHKSSDTNAGWLPATPFTHVPAPSTCLPCHTKERPAPPHPSSGDCQTCHRFPSWSPI